MGFRKVALLTEIFALTAMSSVGFSSWLAIQTTPVSNEINVNVENITNLNDYITINHIIMSDYNNSGFYDDFTYSDTTYDTGYIETSIDVNLEKFKSEVSSNSTYYFDIDLISKSTLSILGTTYDFFEVVLIQSVTYTYSLTNTSGTVAYPTTSESITEYNVTNYTTNENTISSPITINGGSSDTYLNIILKYKIKVNSSVVSLETFFPTLTAYKGVKFTLVAVMEG